MKKRVTYGEVQTVKGIKSAERETSIHWSFKDDNVIVSTTDNTFITKMKRRLLSDPDHYKCFAFENKDGTVDSYEFEFPLKCLSFRNFSKRSMTEEQRKAVADRMRKNRTDT